MLDAANVLWNARAFDVDSRNLPAGYMQGKCDMAAKAIREALAAEGITEETWEEPIHPFATTSEGEPIHTAEAIVNHTHGVIRGAYDEVELAMSEAGPAAR